MVTTLSNIDRAFPVAWRVRISETRDRVGGVSSRLQCGATVLRTGPDPRSIRIKKITDRVCKILENKDLLDRISVRSG